MMPTSNPWFNPQTHPHFPEPKRPRPWWEYDEPEIQGPILPIEDPLTENPFGFA